MSLLIVDGQSVDEIVLTGGPFDGLEMKSIFSTVRMMTVKSLSSLANDLLENYPLDSEYLYEYNGKLNKDNRKIYILKS